MIRMFRRVWRDIPRGKKLQFDRWCFLSILFAGLGAVACLSVVFSYHAGLQMTPESGFSLHLELREDVSDSVVQELYATIHAFPGVSTVDYRTPTRAYLLLQEADPQEASFLEKHHIGNPFSPSLLVTLRSPEVRSTFRDFIVSSQWKDAIQPSSFLMAPENEMQDTPSLFSSVSMALISILLLIVCISILTFAETLTRFSLESGELFVGQLSGMSLSRILVSFTIWFAFVFLCAFVVGYGVTLLILYSLDVFSFIPFSFTRIFGALLVEIVMIPFLGHSVSLWLMSRSLQKPALGLRS
ncbi:hypothetical protein A2635_03755 [Candidatus Peribacteria bacterium RIFCSPHIGHO2_01_FULL_51_9]|nr:MAG: hypothetical protein A2635_03755 [Candidatus Peribacteria bacterium RIFCSPHIGHO2_01_FULL_51_9]